jgi:hypothetical protein
MKIMKRLVKKSFSFFPKLLLLTILIVALFLEFVPLSFLQAATYQNAKDTMTRLKVSTTADHKVVFQLPAGVTFDASGTLDYLRVDFPHTSAFTQSGTWATSDFTFNDGTARTINAVAQGAGVIDVTCTNGANNVGVAIDTTNHIFTIKPCGSSYTASGAGATITFEIFGTSPNGTLTNPSSAGSYKVDLAMCDETSGCGTTFVSSHTGALAVAIITDDQVVVSATVDPTITFTLSTNSINLGTLSTSSVSTASMTAQTQTNAPNGYSATVVEDGNLRFGSNDIDDVTDGEVTAGSEEYGLATSDSGQQIIQDTNCPAAPFNASAITSTPQTFGGETTGPVNETVTLCFAASITGTTVAGTYQHTLTLISTGQF